MALRSIPPPEFYTWTFPGAPVRVRVLLDVVRDLHQILAVDATREDAQGPKRRGILLGTTGPETEIDDVAPCSILGAAAVTAALQSLKPSRDVKPVGFYRAQFEEQLDLTEEDLAIAQAHFTHPGHVFLVIHLSAKGPDNATFFFWHGSRIQHEFAFLEFPFDVSWLMERERRRTAQADEKPAVQQKEEPKPAPAPPPLPPPPVVRPTPAPPLRLRERHADRTILVLGVVALMMLVVAFLLSLRLVQQPATADVPPGLGLKLQHQGSDIAVTWDREAADRNGAQTGLLTIRDGAKERSIHLSLEQLRSANILVSPASDQVQIDLSLSPSNKDTVKESVMAVSTLRRPAPVGSKTASSPSRRQVQTEPAPVPVVSGEAERTAGAEPPAPPQPSYSVFPPLVESHQASQVAAPTSPMPPQLLYAPDPPYPPDAYRARVQGTVVVEAMIDADGTVRRTTAISGPGLLRDAAAGAVRGWRFRPAIQNGKPVAAPVRVDVRFQGTW